MTTRTTRGPREPQLSVLAALRGLVPNRRLSTGEALRIAELQANRLRDYLDIDGAALASEAICELPRIAVEHDPDLPVSGSAHWNAHQWVITLNASEPVPRQRFSMLHELKHIVDHTTRHHLYGRDGDPAARQRAEWAADHFAACALMPKRWVKRLWGEGHQNTTGLAADFGVSTQAMRYRLHELGLTEPPARCHPDTFQYERAPRKVAA